jgi:hypothetical protein
MPARIIIILIWKIWDNNENINTSLRIKVISIYETVVCLIENGGGEQAAQAGEEQQAQTGDDDGGGPAAQAGKAGEAPAGEDDAGGQAAQAREDGEGVANTHRNGPNYVIHIYLI